LMQGAPQWCGCRRGSENGKSSSENRGIFFLVQVLLLLRTSPARLHGAFASWPAHAEGAKAASDTAPALPPDASPETLQSQVRFHNDVPYERPAFQGSSKVPRH